MKTKCEGKALAINYVPVGSTFESETQVQLVNNETDAPLTQEVTATVDAVTGLSWQVDAAAHLEGSLPRVATGAGFEDVPGVEFDVTTESEVPGTALIRRAIEINVSVEVQPHTALSVVLVLTTQKGVVSISGDAAGTLEVEGVTYGRLRYDEYQLSNGSADINDGLPLTQRPEVDVLLPQ